MQSTAPFATKISILLCITLSCNYALSMEEDVEDVVARAAQHADAPPSNSEGFDAPIEFFAYDVISEKRDPISKQRIGDIIEKHCAQGTPYMIAIVNGEVYDALHFNTHLRHQLKKYIAANGSRAEIESGAVDAACKAIEDDYFSHSITAADYELYSVEKDDADSPIQDPARKPIQTNSVISYYLYNPATLTKEFAYIGTYQDFLDRNSFYIFAQCQSERTHQRHYALGIGHHYPHDAAEQDLNKALECYTKAYNQNDDPETKRWAQLKIGEVYAQLNEFTLAADVFEAAIKQNDDLRIKARACLEAYRLYSKINNPEHSKKATAHLAQAAQQTNCLFTKYSARHIKAELYREREEYKNAYHFYRQVADRHYHVQHRAHAASIIGSWLYDPTEHQHSIPPKPQLALYYLGIARQSIDTPELAWHIAQVKIKLAKPRAEIVPHLEKVQQSSCDAKRKVEAVHTHALLLYDDNARAEALKKFEESQQIAQEHNVPYTEADQYLLALYLNEAHTAENCKKARDAARRMLTHSPTLRYHAYTGLAIIAHTEQEYEKALDHYVHALANTDNAIHQASAYLTMGTIYYKERTPTDTDARDYSKAFECFQAAQLRDPQNSQIHYYLGLLYTHHTKIKNPEQALQHFTICLSLSGLNPADAANAHLERAKITSQGVHINLSYALSDLDHALRLTQSPVMRSQTHFLAATLKSSDPTQRWTWQDIANHYERVTPEARSEYLESRRMLWNIYAQGRKGQYNRPDLEPNEEEARRYADQYLNHPDHPEQVIKRANAAADRARVMHHKRRTTETKSDQVGDNPKKRQKNLPDYFKRQQLVSDISLSSSSSTSSSARNAHDLPKSPSMHALALTHAATSIPNPSQQS